MPFSHHFTPILKGFQRNSRNRKIQGGSFAEPIMHFPLFILSSSYEKINHKQETVKLTPTVPYRRKSKAPESIRTFIALSACNIALAFTLSCSLIACSVVCNTRHETVTGWREETLKQKLLQRYSKHRSQRIMSFIWPLNSSIFPFKNNHVQFKQKLNIWDFVSVRQTTPFTSCSRKYICIPLS